MEICEGVGTGEETETAEPLTVGSIERPIIMNEGFLHRGRFYLPILALILILGVFPSAVAQKNANDRIVLHLNTDEAEAALAILDKSNAKQPIGDADWQRLFATEPYTRLKKREASMHRDFTDDDFKNFVLSGDLLAKKDALRHTLEEWKKADLNASARRVLAYLPEQAHIRASVFPVIKPKANSFVFEPGTDPAIFLYLDPDESAAKFENTVAHELHHIGFASASSLAEARTKDLPANVKAAVEWMGAFGEGFAMLAAAGSPDVHPHASSSPEERARWDHDMANFNQDLETLQSFFVDVINQKLKTKDEIDERAYTFFGVQGPWYTVGYKMAVVIEKHYGGATLIECMLNPATLLARYDDAATEINRGGKEHLALWSPELTQSIAAPK